MIEFGPRVAIYQDDQLMTQRAQHHAPNYTVLPLDLIEVATPSPTSPAMVRRACPAPGTERGG